LRKNTMPRRFAPRLFLTISQKVKIGGLFTKKFELYFKGSAASAPTHSPRHLYRSAFGLVKSRFEHTKKLRSIFQCKENAKILKNKNLNGATGGVS